MARVVVIAGGTSGERDISLRSGDSVMKALQAAGHEVSRVDTADDWQTIAPIIKQAEVAFIALHGTGGEDGTIQRRLDELGIPYTGSDAPSSKLCFHKFAFGELMAGHHVLMPETELVDSAGFQASALRQAPYVLKPDAEGSSLDTFVVRDPGQADETQLLQVIANYSHMLLQRLIVGTEISVPVMADHVLPVIEIVPPPNQEFDYANKYNGATQELCPPQHVSPELQAAAQKLAHRVHALAGCRDLSRTDMIIDQTGQIFVLETNTIPGLTEQSLLPKAAAVAGFTMPVLVDLLVQRALARR